MIMIAQRFLFLIALLVGTSLSAIAKIDEAAVQDDLSFFADSAASELRPGFSKSNLAEMKTDEMRAVAAAMLDQSYDRTYRIADYEAYPSAAELGRTLKLGNNFSHYENITGIYLEQGENIVIVGDTHGKEISLLIPDWMRQAPEGIDPTKDPAGWGLHKQQIKLQSGINRIDFKKAGTVYVSYYDDHAEDAPPITVHFPTGKVNGYFDLNKGHTNQDWDALLENAVAPIMDARGKHIQVAYPVKWFKQFTQGKGVELIGNYDTMLNLQYTLLGLVKYDRVPKNRILSRVNFHYYMFRDGDGVAYLGNQGTMRMVADPDVVVKGDPCWGFNHEVGHALQMSPQFTWGGLTEVSNNVMTLYVTTAMGNKSRLAGGNSYAGGRKRIIEADPKISYLADPDVFHRLVPFWQLHLYFTKHGQPDFYADVMETMRQQPDAGRGNDAINNQFEFIKICSDVGKTDLTEFFEQWGFFWVGEIEVNDYRKYKYKITQEMVNETKAYVAGKNYPKPKEDLTKMQD